MIGGGEAAPMIGGGEAAGVARLRNLGWIALAPVSDTEVDDVAMRVEQACGDIKSQ